MAIVVMFEVSGMTSEKYDGVMRDLDAAGLEHPDGRRFHVSYGSKEKLQVIDVFDSPARLEAFGGKLMPILQKYGITARPQVLGDVHRNVIGR